jgi:hypothetical protein
MRRLVKSFGKNILKKIKKFLGEKNAERGYSQKIGADRSILCRKNAPRSRKGVLLRL